ncbi:MAG: exodeoxyribonuclease VII large subunit [Clostridium sp.]|nr:exodeoxyribonuclease VII large subunit [Clostridium sp.]
MNKAWSVGEVNRYISNMFGQDFLLRNIAVQGEISNCKYHTSGHIYFSLKDETGAIACVMFAGQRKGLAFRMKDGDKVIVTGSVSVYERDGRYQLYARQITLVGAGLLYEKFLALKQELEEMGMFAPQYKQPIPKVVRRLGVVTAPTGAAIQDIRNIALRRNPYVQIILYPALVQGEGAKESIVKGIQTLDKAGVDVMIVGRGGGSIEDLWAFNEECVARAVFECGTPVISAVGHETDTTIIDYVADLRAPTPSAAAELAVMDVRAFDQQLMQYQTRLDRSMINVLQNKRQQLAQIKLRLTASSPENQLLQKKQYLDELSNRMQYRMQEKYTASRNRLELFIERLNGLSPLRRLSRGYAYVADPKGNSIISVDQVQAGDSVSIHVTDGCIRALVQKKERIERREET